MQTLVPDIEAQLSECLPQRPREYAVQQLHFQNLEPIRLLSLRQPTK